MRIEVNFDYEVEPEDDTSFRDEFDDPETVDWIREQLLSGNEYAWCRLEVKCRFEFIDDGKGGTGWTLEETESEYLGGCSYSSRQSLMSDDGYVPQMRNEARRGAFENVQRTIRDRTLSKKMKKIDRDFTNRMAVALDQYLEEHGEP